MTARTRTGVGAKKFSNKSLNTPGRTLFRGLCNPYSLPLFVHPHPRNNMAGSQYHLCRVKNTLSPSCSIPRRKARLRTTLFPFPRRAIAANLVFHPPHLRGPRRFPFSSIPLSLSILLFPLRVQLSAYNSLKISGCLPARAVTRQQAWKIRGTTIVDHSAFIPANVPPFLSPIRSGDFKWESSRGMVHSSLPLFSRQGSATY